MTAALRLLLAAWFVAAAAMTSAGHAATTCPTVGTKATGSSLDGSGAVAANAWKSEARSLAFKETCPQNCRTDDRTAAHEAPAPLPLAIVTHAEDVADWHAGIFERLASERADDGPTRYCGVDARKSHAPL
jgi:hypothetical protein